MNASNGQSLEDVFKKWEKKGEERRLNSAGNMTNLVGVQDSHYGRAAWQQKFDASALPRRRSNRKKHNVFEEVDSRNFNSVMSEQVVRKFQLIPPVVKDYNHTSGPFCNTGCSKCYQRSIKIMFTNEKIKHSPLRNLLDLSVFCRRNFFRAAFGGIFYVANLPKRKNKKITDIDVLSSPGVCSTIERLTTTSQEKTASALDLKSDNEALKQTSTPVQLQAEAKKMIKSMSGTIKGYLIKFATWILFKFFGKTLSSIHVHQGQIAVVHEASKRNIPLVYLPLHKSHVDYALISFVLSWYGVKVPYIAAGDNLKDIPLFSWLMRNMGGFFIRRKLGELSSQNELYRAVMNELMLGLCYRTFERLFPAAVQVFARAYVAEILMSGSSLEIFVEGTRSRSGKSYPPKIGVLSSVVSLVKEGRVSDVMVVPVNISYEKVLETGYADELMGKPKIAESFSRTVKSIWRICRSNFGQVRVDFGLPFSLTEMVHSSECSMAWQTFMKTSSLNSALMNYNTSETSVGSLPDSLTTALTKAIARHVIYDCTQNSTIMGTNMVAFLLLTKFRKGVELKEFANAFELLKKDIRMHKRDYGFSGANEDVILHSVELLGKDLVSWNPESRVVKPVHSLAGLLQLSYYSNQVLSVFVLESVVACSIGALLADENLSLAELIYPNTTISRRDLLSTALDLCDLLKREFIFSPPCISLETVIIDAIEKFIAADVLNVHEGASTKSRERQWANRLAVSTAWSDNEESEEETEFADQEYEINSLDEAIQKLRFFRDILSPIIESYWFVASSLLCLCDGQHIEDDFINFVHKAALSRVSAGTALFDESCSLVSITNAIKVFKEFHILEQQTNLSTSNLMLNAEQSDVLDLIAHINRYKS